MEQQLNIETTPACISVNFDDVAEALDAELAQYTSLVVTPDNIKVSKKAATELNKFANHIDRQRKDAVKEASAPIRVFDDQMKSLFQRCKDTRQGIIDQVEVYEDEAREQAKTALDKLVVELWDENNVADEYRTTEYTDLATLSALTEKGKLTKAARESLEGRVAESRAFQDRVAARLMALENASYKAGLDVPLTRESVENFLYADSDDEYEAKLARLIESEVNRQQQANAKREQAATREREAAEVEAQRREQEAERRGREEAARHARHEAEEAARRAAGKCDGNHAGSPCADPECWNRDPVEAPPGCDVFRVTLTFDVSVPADKGVVADQVKDKVLRKLADAGVPAPDHVVIQEMQGNQEQVSA